MPAAIFEKTVPTLTFPHRCGILNLKSSKWNNQLDGILHSSKCARFIMPPNLFQLSMDEDWRRKWKIHGGCDLRHKSIFVRQSDLEPYLDAEKGPLEANSLGQKF